MQFFVNLKTGESRTKNRKPIGKRSQRQRQRREPEKEEEARGRRKADLKTAVISRPHSTPRVDLNRRPGNNPHLEDGGRVALIITVQVPEVV